MGNIEFTKVIKFADDLQLYIDCNVSEIEEINAGLENVVQFEVGFGMELNPEKSKAIIVSSLGVILSVTMRAL